MVSGRYLKRSATVLGLVAAAVFGLAPAASANWESYIVDWTDGHTSNTKWADEHYNQILFHGCWAQNSLDDKVDVKLWEYDTFSGDDYYGPVRTFTECFNSDTAQSEGQRTGLPEEDSYYFETDEVAQGDCCLLTVRRVYVDTTKADS